MSIIGSQDESEKVPDVCPGSGLLTDWGLLCVMVFALLVRLVFVLFISFQAERQSS